MTPVDDRLRDERWSDLRATAVWSEDDLVVYGRLYRTCCMSCEYSTFILMESGLVYAICGMR